MREGANDGISGSLEACSRVHAASPVGAATPRTRSSRRGYLQNPFGVQVPVVGGMGQSALVVHAFVQTRTIMTFSHSL